MGEGDRGAPRIGHPVTLGHEHVAARTILLVEDAPEVRTVARRILQRHGYVVLEAAEAELALTIARREGEVIDLLLTDVVLPGISGPELAAQIRALCPNAKVLFMSGHTKDAAEAGGGVEPGDPYLEKPFSVTALARKVREVLAS